MNEEVAVVTGSSRGIGYATAEGLAKSGFAVYVCSRDLARARTAADAIAKTTGGTTRPVEADFTSLEGVRDAARQILATTESVQVLINNAAIIPKERNITKDGFEMQFGVNYLAAFLLTNLLLPKMRGKPARIINVSSQVHNRTPLNLNDVQSTFQPYDRLDVYSRSKLAMIYFSEELASRTKTEAITVNAVHPGVISTELLSDYYGFGPVRRLLGNARGNTTEEGAIPLVRLAIDDDVAQISGSYFHKLNQRVPDYPDENKDAVARDLWKLSAALTQIN